MKQEQMEFNFKFKNGKKEKKVAKKTVNDYLSTQKVLHNRPNVLKEIDEKAGIPWIEDVPELTLVVNNV